jgi:Bifunctional DNA primase/polymerase, N-terminal
MTPLEAALATGLPCFPCGRNKTPAIPGDGGFKHATADPAALRALWRRYPGPLVGVRTGEASGLSVLDIDTAKHREAEIWFAAHRARLPVTRMHQTRSGGLRLVLQHRAGVRNRQSPPGLAKGVDARGEGGSAIWWPAAGYLVLWDAPPAPWPDWLLQALLWRPPAPAIAATGSDGY